MKNITQSDNAECQAEWQSRTKNQARILTLWSRVLVEGLTSSQLVKKFPAFYGTRRFITAFTSAWHLSPSCARTIRSITPHPTSWISNLILSSHLCLCLSCGSFPQIYSPKPRMHLSSLHTCYMPLPSHSSWFDQQNNIWSAVQIITLLII